MTGDGEHAETTGPSPVEDGTAPTPTAAPPDAEAQPALDPSERRSRRERHAGERRPDTRRIAIRRGVVLGLLVVAILTATAFARESNGGLLHSAKGAVTGFTGRVQDIAVTAARPFRDAWNWFAELRTVRDERNRLASEVRRLQSEQAGVTVNDQRLAELERLLKVADERPSDYRAIGANVIARPLVDVARDARLDKGSADGVTVNSLVLLPAAERLPVCGAGVASSRCWYGALVGRVTRVDAGTSDIVFLTSTETRIAARTMLGQTQLGLLSANALGDLIVTGVPSSAALSLQDPVVTMGVGTNRLMSPYPPGIPIGYVSSFGGADTGGDYTVQVTPYANPNAARTVVVYIPKTALAKRRAGIR